MLAVEYTPGQFCHQCGSPYPWANRQARLYELENILQEDDTLTDADRLTLREQIEALMNPDLDETEEAERWKRLKKVAPTLLDAGRAIVVSVASAYAQKQLGI
jgi:hypothetical protein